MVHAGQVCSPDTFFGCSVISFFCPYKGVLAIFSTKFVIYILFSLDLILKLTIKTQDVEF